MKKAKRILSMFLAVMMIVMLIPFSVIATDIETLTSSEATENVENDTTTDNSDETTSVVAKVDSRDYETFADAFKAANALTGDVVVEIYGEVEFVDDMELNGSYTSISFIGKSDNAKITIKQSAGGDYLEAHGKTVTFTDLILAKANPAWSGNAGHMGNYFSIQGGTATYNNCTFANGACTSGGTATYNNCTFENASEYGLWVYDDAIITVNGGTINSAKGIKVYSEDEGTVTSTLTVQNATFTENVTSKPAVAIGYATEIKLLGNTYNNKTGVLELDSGSDADCEGVVFVAQDAEGNDIANTLTAIDRSNSSAACGVLVDGKIYTTVSEAAKEATSGSTVTLMYNTTETVELAEGVKLNTNGYTAENLTVKVSVPEGTITPGYILNHSDATGGILSVKIWGEASGNAKESFVIKIYAENGTLMGTTSLVNIGGIIDGNVNVTWSILLDAESNTDEYWTMKWDHAPSAEYVPAKVVVCVDGKDVCENVVKFASPDDVKVVRVAELDANGNYVAYYANLEAALKNAKDNAILGLVWNEGDAPIAMNGAVYGKTVTITGTAQVDWNQGYLFVGRGGEGNGTVIFDNANLISASDSKAYGIHVSGREKDTTNKYDGTLIIKNSTIELDYLINKGKMTLDNSTLTVKNGFSVGGRPASETESGEDATATLTLNNASKLVVNNHNGMGLGYEAIGIMNVNSDSTFECTQKFLVTAKGTMNVNGGTVVISGTLTNNGTVAISGASDISATVSGDGWVYMHSATLSEKTVLKGAKVRFASGTNEVNGSQITDGFFQVGIGSYNGQDANVDTENGVVVNVKNAVIDANGETYAGWIGTGFYDTDAEKAEAMTGAKYILNIENSIARFGYLHISNDGELNVKGNASEKEHYNNSYYSFYAGDLIINGVATFDSTDVLALYAKISCDNGTDKPGTLNIVNGAEFEAERHNGAIGGTNFVLYKTGVVNVDATSDLYIGEYTEIAESAVLNIAGTVTALGTITNNGTINITSQTATITTPEITTNDITLDIDGYELVYKDGAYVVEKIHEIFGKTFYIINMDTKLSNGTTYYGIGMFTGINSLEYKEVGFYVTVGGVTKKIAVSKVYNSVTANGNTITAENVAGTYIFGVNIWIPDADAEVTYQAYAIDLDGNEIKADKTVTTGDIYTK